MVAKKLIYYILAGFITGTLLLVYIQYNSAKNINELITGNEKLLKEFNVSNELKDLEKDVLSVESKIRGTVTTRDSSHIEGLEKQIQQIETDLDQLQKVSDDDSSIKYIDELDLMVKGKLQHSHQILDSFHITGKTAAENVIATSRGRLLTDSITQIITKIDRTRKRHLADATNSIDTNGKKAKQFSTLLIVLVLMAAALLFWYIINIVHKLIEAIHDLNVSEKKVREAAGIKENFMANMSHEIRTPLNAILGFINLLQRRPLDPKSKEYADTIQRSGENLLNIINDILDLSKIEAGMIRIESAPFSIRSVTHAVEAMFAHKAIEKNITLYTNVEGSVPDTLEGDATRLTQILVNLAGNALKFTNEGSIIIHITDEGQSESIIHTGITITDTGIGIAPEKLKIIFERFQQADDAVTRKFGGTGLGLSIVNDLVQLQQGTIQVESKPGKGTCFKIIIPYKISAENLSTTAAAANTGKLMPPFRNAKVLVAEDNETNKNLIRHLFNEWQLDFDFASNGREAIEMVLTQKYNLILMDIQMPEMDGYTATREIRHTYKLDTPIIAMTAHALAGERDKCIRYGMNDYISKPILEKQLYNLIAHFILAEKQESRSKKVTGTNPHDEYQYINLGYMKEVSGGNTVYEKTVTGQFIEAIPADLEALEMAWQQNNIGEVRRLAHDMKTTVSVMGLNEALQPHLDKLEYEILTESGFRQSLSFVTTICNAALAESKQFYTSL